MISSSGGGGGVSAAKTLVTTVSALTGAGVGNRMRLLLSALPKRHTPRSCLPHRSLPCAPSVFRHLEYFTILSCADVGTSAYSKRKGTVPLLVCAKLCGIWGVGAWGFGCENSSHHCVANRNI